MTTVLLCAAVLLYQVCAWALCRGAAQADQRRDEREREQ